jgi:DNA processing protein
MDDDEAAALAWFAGTGERARLERERLAAAGARLVGWGDRAYPHALRRIADPPLVLAVRGTLVADEPMVAIVGARRASEYGRQVAADLGRGLARAGITVVSGLAPGIDAAAHCGTLEAGGRTLAVLATGIDRVSPVWHAELAREIARQGALLTEYACGAPALPFHFPRRNRLLSGLALGVVVVEAAEGSGALITARWAAEQRREVFAVPGPIGRPLQSGPHRLIQQGARLVTGVEDILEVLALAGSERVSVPAVAPEQVDLTPVERRLLDTLGAETEHVDALVRRADVALGAALETLLGLELRGLVEQCPGSRFRRRAA